MIRVKDLYHSYARDENYAVKGVSFEIQKGEIFGFLGPNGAGKSTTQKILTGLLPLQKGEARVNGTDLRHPKPSFFNKIGVSFEQPNLYAKLTGLENLKFFAALYDGQKADPMELLRMVGLEDAAGKKAGQYSKGMQQRLVFARSLLNRPSIWFLDEPVSGLDPTTSARIKEVIRQKARDEGITVFLTTHNMHVAEELCDRVAFINAGEISTIDSPRNLKLRYGEKTVRVEMRNNGSLQTQSFSLTESKDIQQFQQVLQGGSVETIHTQEATLEDIFIRLTGRGLS